MIALWMLYAVGVSLALCVAAAGAERALRLGRGPGRWVWVAALGGSVLLPLLAKITGSVPLSLVAGEAGGGGLLGTVGAGGIEGLAGMASGGASAAGDPGAGAPLLEHARRLGSPLLAGWALLSVVLGGRLLAEGLRRRRRRRRRWRPGRLDGRRVLVTASAGPALAGSLRPEIVVPEWLRELPRELRVLALEHEEEHRAAGDPWLVLGAELLRVLLPWNPAIHWGAARLRRAAEMDCDRRLLRRGADPRRYGRLLLAVGCRSRASAGLGAVALMERRTNLERRIAMLKSDEKRWKSLRIAGMSAVALGALAVACETPLPPPGDQESPAAEDAAGEVAAWDAAVQGESPLFVVDGVIRERPPSSEEMDAREIGKIEVVKGEAARALYGQRAEDGLVRITTDQPSGTLRAVEAPGDEAGSSVGGMVRLREVPAGEADGPTATFRLRETTGGSAAGGTVSAAGAPLVVVDGVILKRDAGPYGELARLDPATVEKIEVVKGEEARARYGERAKDGVVLVTTKDGG